MFGHELAHSMEMVNRGQEKRLKLQNYGWAIGQFGHTAKTATIECRVFALQYLFEEAAFGHQCADILSLKNASMFLSIARSKSVWKSEDECKVWVKERKPEYRILDFMEEHRPNFKSLLDKTVDYIVDECAELV